MGTEGSEAGCGVAVQAVCLTCKCWALPRLTEPTWSALRCGDERRRVAVTCGEESAERPRAGRRDGKI